MSQKSFRRVLIANRGEIAVRVARTLRDLEITPVAIYSEADRIAPHVRVCDMAFPVGPAAARESYLRIDHVIEAARLAAADAIHPGYGFLAENPNFAQAVVDAGMTFIGPPAQAMRVMGTKTSAREAMIKAGVPVVPGSDGPIASLEDATRWADKLGYPVMLKAAAGGGGKGMRLANNADELESGFRAACSEAHNAFGDDTVYMEKVIVNPRHIEIQILSGPDSKTVYLGERECSMQRRHQKVIEESPSLAVSDELRRKMGGIACKAAESVGYVGAGTLEFLLDEQKNFYFLEMNARLQVEHPVTERVYGVDLVEEQVRIAQGQPLRLKQENLRATGHAIEARVYAEDPHADFIPCPGFIEDLVLPQGPGVRVDSGVTSHFEVPRHYDPMIAKIIAWGEDRERARRRLSRALGETAVKGITTNTSFLRCMVEQEEFKRGTYNTNTVAELLERKGARPPEEILTMAVAATVINAYRRDTKSSQPTKTPPSPKSSGWRNALWR